MRLHRGDLEVDASVVRDLIKAQFPRFGHLAVQPVDSTGTVNWIYRLGDDFVLRLPRSSHWEPALKRELEWLPKLSKSVSLDVPEPVAFGQPSEEYPLTWAIYRWIEGEIYEPSSALDQSVAEALADFVLELRGFHPIDGAPSGGRKPLSELDEVTQAAIASAADVIDPSRTISSWRLALEAPAWDGVPVWIHCDLLPPNLLVRGDRLTAILDFGGLGVGDPAADVVPAWSVLGPSGRERFRAMLDVDEAVWQRARGYALHQAVMIVPYYRETNPRFVEMAMRTLGEVLADPS